MTAIHLLRTDSDRVRQSGQGARRLSTPWAQQSLQSISDPVNELGVGQHRSLGPVQAKQRLCRILAQQRMTEWRLFEQVTCSAGSQQTGQLIQVNLHCLAPCPKLVLDANKGLPSLGSSSSMNSISRMEETDKKPQAADWTGVNGNWRIEINQLIDRLRLTRRIFLVLSCYWLSFER